ncbi:uncharacterized protein F5Z01DRAFT_233646 [Emericellopsis atlantica]|uniref:Uncharacterized protein n=1 Tax=Emericellopsis atlantica TaxID=2614577 RepID=A0A9P7ZIB7_9HYPO|nr:uncharacterized protein F5Z01DRAFT_233646 [Emericellopsis atlantica]KAG9252565.1 hypothetical protein F5Z01DRAFT_233646 [Emericellopsis atlantica]
MHFSTRSVALTAFGTLVAGHGAIIAATGDMGGSGMAIGIDPSTPRDGTRDVPFQQDTTVFDGDAEFACGETDQTAENDGVNEIESGVAKVMTMANDSLPMVSQGGELTMTLHQVNGDGAGPYVCMIDATGTGTNWVAMDITQQVPGRRGRNNDGDTTDFPLSVKVAQDQMCMGNVAGMNNVCMVRCQNPRGPFGGCVPIQMGGNATATANPVMSQTGGTAEDDIDAIVDAAEAADGGRGGRGNRGGLASLFNRSKAAQMSEAKRERLESQERVRAMRLARKEAKQAARAAQAGQA